MRPTILDILIFLFEHHIDDDLDLDADRDHLKSELLKAGFDGEKVAQAFDWLHELATTSDAGELMPPQAHTSMRVYNAVEERKLDAECRGFLYFLEQAKVLDSTRRELIIDRVLALESDDIDIEALKWVILMVLFNQPGYEQTFMWAEELVMDNIHGNLH